MTQNNIAAPLRSNNRSRLWNQVRFWVGIVVSVGCLYLALRDIDLPKVGQALTQADYRPVAAAVAVVVLSAFTRAARWRVLFYPRQQNLRFSKLFSIILIGQTINIAIPARLGDVARAYLIGELEGRSKALALGTIAVEKLADMVMLVVLFLALVPVMALPRWLTDPGRATALVVAVFTVLMLVVAYQRERLLLLTGKLLSVFPELAREKIVPRLERALGSLDVLHDWRAILGLTAWTLATWGLYVLNNWLVLIATGLKPSWLVATFLLVVLQAGVAVPSSPGKLGVFHYLCILSLAVFGVPRPVALSYGVILHLVVNVPPVLLGVFFLWRENLSLRRLAG